MNRSLTGVPARHYAAVVIGGSAGGLAALGALIAALPARISLPIMVVLHQHPGAGHHWSDYLATRTSLPVVGAEDKTPLAAGAIYCAPANYHLLVDSANSLGLSVDEKVNYARPSIDLLFSSAAEVFGPALIGVILTGANNDGAMGLADIAANGGLTMVQSPGSAEWPIMPESALRAVPGALELDLEKIAAKLAELIRENDDKG